MGTTAKNPVFAGAWGTPRSCKATKTNWNLDLAHFGTREVVMLMLQTDTDARMFFVCTPTQYRPHTSCNSG